MSLVQDVEFWTISTVTWPLALLNRGTEIVVSWKRMWYWAAPVQDVVQPASPTLRKFVSKRSDAQLQRIATLTPATLVFTNSPDWSCVVPSEAIRVKLNGRRSLDTESTIAS